MAIDKIQSESINLADITGIYFFTSSGTMNRGTVRLYGLNKT